MCISGAQKFWAPFVICEMHLNQSVWFTAVRVLCSLPPQLFGNCQGSCTHIQTHTCDAWLHLIEITVANTQNTQQKRCNSTCCAASFPANVLARLQLPPPALTSLCPPSSCPFATPAAKHNKNTDVRQQAPQTAPHRTPLLLLRLRRLAARQHWQQSLLLFGFP